MAATDELRALLDERGVEWQKPLSIMEQYKTVWRNGPWEYTAVEISGGVFGIYAKHREWLAPKQVVEATLGSGTCHRLPADNFGTTCIVRGHGYEMEFGYWKCSECGTNCFEGARYCMNCGAKVVGE